MHPAAMEWIGRHATDDEVRVLDVGGRVINGTPRDLFPNATEYVVVDLVEHPSVDIVADILDLKGSGRAKTSVGLFDVIVYAEVAEHSPDWAAHLAHMVDLLQPDGRLIVTAAGPTRAPHSAADGQQLRDDEFYENIDPTALADALYELGDLVTVEEAGDDVRAVLVKG